MDGKDEDRETVRVAIGGRYLAGRCTAFAVALARRTGWGLVAIRDGRGALMHSGCRTPDGYADVRGRLDEASFDAGFGGSIHGADEATLLSEHPQDEAMIEEADAHAELLFDLPGRSARRARIEDFAVALDALCRERGVYLRGAGAGLMDVFVAYPAYGEEAGFDVAMQPTGAAFLRRRLS